jgi:hypothetical protein
VIKENRDLEAREAKLGGQDPEESQGIATDNEEPIINTIVSLSRSSVASLDISETKESPLVHDFESHIETAEMGGAADGAPALVPLRMEKQLLELIDAASDKVISLSQLPELFKTTFGAPISYERFGHSKLKDLLDVIPSISVKWKQKGYECMRLVEQTNTPHHVQKHNPPTPSAGPEIKHSQGGAYGGVQKELLELIDAAPGKVILLSKLPGLFKTTFGAPISYKRFGHSKLKNLLDAIPSISVKGTQPGYEFMCRVEQTNTPHHVQKENPLTPTPSAGMEIKHSQGGADGAPALVPLRVEKELLELIDAAPGKVISLCQLPEVFKTTFGAPVYCKQFDHKMLKELLEQLSSIAIGRNPVSGKEYIYSNNRGGNMIPFAPSEDLDLRQAHLPEAPPYSATSWRDLTLVMDGAAKKLVSTSICPQIIATSNENPNGVTPSQLIVSTNGLIEAVEEEEPSDFDTGASLQLIETVEQLDRVLNLAPFARSRNYCAQEMVAIDCEGVPEKLFLVQVATGRVTYIFDCVKLGAKTVCEVLADMLKDETVTKLFHDLHKDAVAFAVIGQIHCLRGSFDTQLAMEYITGNIYMGFNRMLKQLGIEPHPTKHSMKKRMEGGTIFAKRPMASDVIDYAADDVRLLIRCKEKLATVLGDWDSWHSVQLASDKRAAMASRNGGARQICFDAANSYAVASLELLEEKCPGSMSIPTPLVVSDELDILMKLLPDDLVRDFTGMEGVLSDIVLDIGRSPHAWVGQNRVMLGGNDRIVAQTDIDGVVEKLGGFGADNRAGLERQLHRISAVRNRESEIIGLTMRYVLKYVCRVCPASFLRAYLTISAVSTAHLQSGTPCYRTRRHDFRLAFPRLVPINPLLGRAR